MILEVENETRDFLSVYGKDFQPRIVEKLRLFRRKPSYPPPYNVLNGPFKNYLNTRRRNLSLPLNERSQDPQEILSKIHEKYPSFKKYFSESLPDEDLIDRKEKEIPKTVYILDYSKNIDDYSPRKKISGRKKSLIDLPQDWIISETIQKKAYRNPWKIVPEKLLHYKKPVKPFDNLSPSHKEREILRVRTGYTEYNSTIDVTGNRIIDEQLHGAPLPYEPVIYSKGPDSPKSECSQILASKPIVLPSQVI